jgi:hypothetical protein
MIIYPEYSADGGADSERTTIKQLVQKGVPKTSVPLFTPKQPVSNTGTTATTASAFPPPF